MKLASRLERIEPFYVMEMAKAAQARSASPACDPALGGQPMIYMNIGEPDFTATAAVQHAASACMTRGQTQYTAATGLIALRRAISRWYAQRWKVEVDPSRIVITAGASAALQLISLALFESGDEVLMPDPCYPCNRHFVSATGATATLLPTTVQQRFTLSASQVAARWQPHTRGVLLASPSNPTGTSIHPQELAAVHQVVRDHGGVLLVDEIYLGLCYDSRYARSALQLGEDIISINSFSKYFGMTGWRLGWLVLPPDLVAPVEKLAQNFYICPSSLAQHAALACFEDTCLHEYERRRGELERRRDLAVQGLSEAGLPVPVVPDGAFYVWAQSSAWGRDSFEVCLQLIEHAHVVLTPGRDFGPTHARDFIRLSYATDEALLRQAVDRLRDVRNRGILATGAAERLNA